MVDLTAPPIPTSAVALDRGTVVRTCARLAAAEAVAWFRPGRRDRHAALSEYESRWADQGRDARWRRAADLAEAVRLSSFGNRHLRALIDHRAWAVPAPDFFGWRALRLGQLFAGYGRDTPVVEIGCGLGKNLLALAAAGFGNLTGLDPTPSAVRAVAAQSDHFGLSVRTGYVDLLRPLEGKAAQAVAGSVVFTNHVLEQFPGRTGTALDHLLAARPAEVVHLEPCRELLNPTRSAVDAATVWHMRAANYQTDLLTQLRQRAAEGRLRILGVERLGYAPRLRHDPVLIRWSSS